MLATSFPFHISSKTRTSEHTARAFVCAFLVHLFIMMFSTHHLGEYFSGVETSLIIFPLGLAKQVGKSKPGPPLGLLFSSLVDVLV